MNKYNINQKKQVLAVSLDTISIEWISITREPNWNVELNCNNNISTPSIAGWNDELLKYSTTKAKFKTTHQNWTLNQ